MSSVHVCRWVRHCSRKTNNNNNNKNLNIDFNARFVFLLDDAWKWEIEKAVSDINRVFPFFRRFWIFLFFFYFFSFWRKRRFPSLARWFQRNLPGGIPGTRCWLFCHWTVRRAWVKFEIIATDKWKFCCGESEMLEKKTVNRWGQIARIEASKLLRKIKLQGKIFYRIDIFKSEI